MSATATASDAPKRARRTRWAPRWLVATHRYLGVVLGGLMLVWCLSGAVMLFSPYPSLRADERIAHLPPIDWSRCCRLDTAAAPDAAVTSAVIEQIGANPVLRLRTEAVPRVIDLFSGRLISPLGAEAAMAEAGVWGRVATVSDVTRDQWSVSGELNRWRPFWRVRLADGAATDLYVSQATGEIAQRTTRTSRVLGWLGAVPHWLYPTLLRQDTKLWIAVVVWTSLAGTFLTVAGLYLGLIAWRPFGAGDRRVTPFRGLMAWHHLGGLAAGILTLTWVFSGLVSVNPWGFLESGDDPVPTKVMGPPPRFAEVSGALGRAAANRPAVSQLRLAPFDGRVFVMAGESRLDATGRPAPLGAADLAAAGARLGPVAAQGMIATEDAYYFTHHEPVVLPAWRVRLADGRRVYLDPRSGAVLASLDAAAKGYRWLHQGLHRLDVVPGARRGPAWATVSLVLLALVTLGVATGTWLGLRRIGHDFAQLRRKMLP